MQALIATFTIKPEQAQAFETRFQALARDVKANEPGALVYQLTKSKHEPGVYKVMELYKDDKAVQDHISTDYFKAAFADFEPMLAKPVHLDHVDPIG